MLGFALIRATLSLPLNEVRFVTTFRQAPSDKFLRVACINGKKCCMMEGFADRKVGGLKQMLISKASETSKK